MNDMRKLMEAIEQIEEATPAPQFEVGKSVYALYDPNESMFGVVDMGDPKLSPVPRKSTMSDSEEGCLRKKDLILANIDKNRQRLPRMKREFARREQLVNSWVVVEITMRIV